MNSRRRALVAEEHSERAKKAQQDAEQVRNLAEREKEDRTRECLSWREKHQDLAEIIRAQEELKSQRKTKAVSHIGLVDMYPDSITARPYKESI